MRSVASKSCSSRTGSLSTLLVCSSTTPREAPSASSRHVATLSELRGWQGGAIVLEPTFQDGGVRLVIRSRTFDEPRETEVILPSGGLALIGAREGRIGQERYGALAYERVQADSTEVVLIRATVVG